MSKIEITKDYIKVPRDFKSIHNLGDLVEFTDYFNDLHKSLVKYKSKYVTSYYKNVDEVIKYIPKSQLSKYKVHLLNQDVRCFDMKAYPSPEHSEFVKEYDKLTDNAKKKLNENWNFNKELWWYRNESVHDQLRKVAKKNIKMFLVDTLNKTIHVCPWVTKTAAKGSLTKMNYQHKDIEWKIGTTESLNDGLIYMGAGYTYWSTRNKYSEWWRQGQYEDYLATGSFVLVFCTKTNRLLGSLEQYRHNQYLKEKEQNAT